MNCATGEFWHSFDDLSIPGRGVPLDFSRTYVSAAAGSDGPLGFGWTDSYNMSLSFDGSGNTTVSQENGATVSFSPNGSGGYVAAPRVLAKLVKNGDGSYTFTRNREHVGYTFSAVGKLLREVDRNGYQTTLAYDGSGELTSVTDPAARSLSFTYLNGHISTVSDSSGRSVSFGYDSGNLVSATDAAGEVWSFGYDANHLLTSMTDPNHGTTSNVYDPSGRVTSQTDPALRTTTWSYTGNPASAAGGTTTMTGPTTASEPNGNVTVFQYQNLELLSETRGSGTPAAATTTFAYDPATLGRTSVTDPNNHTSTATYNSAGDLTSFTDALHRTTSATYNSFDEPTSVTDPSAVTTSYVYDANGNVQSISRPLGTTATQTVGFSYGDPAHPGDVTSVTDPNNKTTQRTYNSYGDLTSVSDPLGNKTTFAYDNVLGEPTSSVSPRGNVTGADPAQYTTSYVYDPLRRLTKTTDPLGHAAGQTYDGDGNLISSSDGKNNATGYTYNGDNELTKVTRADTTTLRYGYDKDGNQTSQTDGASKTTSYAYDPLDRVSSVTDPLNRSTSYTYDLAGNRKTATDASSRTTTYAYDAANELTAISYANPSTPDVSFTYKPNGLRATMLDGTGTTTYAYDTLNRLTSQTNSSSGQGVVYGYDLASNLTGLTYPNGKTVTRSYDAAGRLTSISDWLGNTTSFTPDPEGNMSGISYANGASASNVYDNADQLKSVTDTGPGNTPLASFTYTRDGNGQLASTAPTGAGQGSNESYSYNPLNQLTAVNSSTYGYDAADNLTKLTDGATLGYDDANQASSYTPQGGTATTLTYDQQGNRLAGLNGVTYTYDRANRLTTASSATGASSLEGAAEDGFAVRKSDGSVWGWGYNNDGQLGNGTTTNSSVPVQASGLAGATKVAAGAYFTLAVKSDGSVWAWGDNFYGQLGDGTTTDSHAPVQTSNLTGATAVAAGHYHSLALKSDGTVWAWGQNASGQLGNNTTTNSSVPVKVSNLTGVVAIAAGGNYGLALKSDGTVWAWGANEKGQLGNNGTTTSKVPVQVHNLTGVHAIAATNPIAGGYEHSLAVKSDGTVWAWGYNAYGQLGNGTIKDSHVPVQVKNITGATGVAAGADHSLAVKSDGSVWAWGLGVDGELGNGGTANSSVPVQVHTVTGATTVAAGDFTSYALTSDGTVWAWGYGGEGELGNGTTTGSTSPGQTNRLGIPVQTSYSYDGDGLRATTTSNGTTQHFAWDISAGLPLLLTDGSTNYLYDDNGLPVEQIDSLGTPLYYQHDQLGSTRLLTNSAGAVAATYSYDPYGNLTGHTGTSDTPLRWAGQYQDADTGIYNLRARYYDPETGQFLSRDPISPVTQSVYAYGLDDPLNGTDASGLCRKQFWTGAFWTKGNCIQAAGDAAAKAATTPSKANPIYDAVNLDALAFYGVYYVSYRDLSSVGSIPIVGRGITLIPPLNALYASECAGLGGDVAIDLFKSFVFGNGERATDEGGPIFPTSIHRGPQVYGPGIHPNGSVDLYPLGSYPWWQGFGPPHNRSGG